MCQAGNQSQLFFCGWVMGTLKEKSTRDKVVNRKEHVELEGHRQLFIVHLKTSVAQQKWTKKHIDNCKEIK